VIVFALFIGVGLTRIPRAHATPLVNVLEGIAQVSVAIIELVMRAAPIGVFALIFSVTARFGFGIVVQLLQYVLTVVVCLGLFNFVFYPAVVKLVAGRKPGEFLRQIRVVMLTAFSTSSSNATLPAALRVTRDELGVRPQIAGFVVPLGATMNQNGSALFQSVAVLFVAQVFGLSLSLAQYAIVATLVVVTAIGTAGVPGGAIPLLMMVLAAVGVPMEGVAIVLGVDRIVDMCRTVVNVTGDIVAAAIVDRFAGPLAAQEVES
jgi:DAACS family dicarboxylate/amino acid:cation (Na+ or H+) symporter